MWQIEQYSTGNVMSHQFADGGIAERLIEAIAHITGINVDDLDAAYIVI